MKKPKFFNCYFDNEVLLNHLSDEQAGKLWKSLFAFVNRDEESALSDPVVALAYEVMAQQIKRDFAKYDEKCEKNKKNGLEKKRTVATASDRKRTVANGSDRLQEEEKEEDKDNNNEEDNEEDKDKEKENTKQAVERNSTTSVSFVKDVIDYLNEKISAHYKATSKSTARLINARVKEGFTLSDFKKVIDNRIDAWGKDKHMQQYLRPETLFSNKFESYLNSSSIKANGYTQIFDYDEEF